jgi:hypothetical protein
VTFAFRGHSVDLLARQGPEEGRLLVTVDGRNVDGLPADSEGRSYLDLAASGTVWQARLPIATGLAAGQHLLRLTVNDGSPGRANVDAFEVNAGQPPAFPILPVAVLGFLLLITAGALLWDLRSRPRREQFF